MHHSIIRTILTLTLLSQTLALSLPQNQPQKPLNVAHLPYSSSSSSSIDAGKGVTTFRGWDVEDLAVGARDEEGNYEGWEVWRFDLRGGKEEERGHFLRIVQLLDVDIWHASKSHLDLFLPSHQLHSLLPLLPSHLHPTTPLLSSSLLSHLLEPSSDLLDEETETTTSTSSSTATGGKRKKHRKTRPTPPPSQPPIPQPPIDPFNLTTLNTPYHDSYHSLANMTAFLLELEKTFPELVRVFSLGVSGEGREVWGVRLHKNKNDGDGVPGNETEGSERTIEGRMRSELKGGKKREFYLQGGQHAREWISPASLLYFAHYLLTNTIALDPKIVRLMETYEFVIVPTINPDGYDYSREHSRLWRKNRQDLGYGNCKGIDMNANWGYQWSPSSLISTTALTTSLTANPCSESYPGSEAFDAIETKLVADYLAATKKGDPDSGRVGNDLRAFVDIHSYGQLFMFPYSYSCSAFPADAETLMEAGLGVAKALRSHKGTMYQAGQACDLVYRMSGDSIDYAYATAGARWSYSVELRDTGTFGFLLPPSLIRETAAEMTEGLIYLANFINVIEGVEKS